MTIEVRQNQKEGVAMASYIIKRVLIAIPVLIGVTIFNFIIINMAPGNPVEMFINPDATAAQIELEKERMGLNDPIWIQYFRWMGNLFQGDFGYSYSRYEPVTQIVFERLGPTLLLMAGTIIWFNLLYLSVFLVQRGNTVDLIMRRLDFPF